jgi:CheY-like chemotaxis protein
MPSRIALILWNAAEAQERADLLRRAGFEVESFAAKTGGPGLRGYRERPPDAFVIDLGRMPSQGRAVGTFVRQQKATRDVPLVFIAGDPEKTAQVRQALPDACYTGWRGIRGALRRAMNQRPASPVVPRTMDAYQGRPLAKKLGLKEGATVALINAPPDFENKLENLPDSVRLTRRLPSAADTILLFVKDTSQLERQFAPAVARLADRGGLWICWPKKGSPAAADLTQAAVRTYGLARGLVDYKICAVDDTWSGLLFTRRRV